MDAQIQRKEMEINRLAYPAYLNMQPCLPLYAQSTDLISRPFVWTHTGRRRDQLAYLA